MRVDDVASNIGQALKCGGAQYNHMLDGDGYCLRLEFLAGGTGGTGGTGSIGGTGSRVKFTSRFIRTEEFKAEVGHGRYRSPRPMIPLDIPPQ